MSTNKSVKCQSSPLRFLILAPSDANRGTQLKDVALPSTSATPLFSTFLEALTNTKPAEDLTNFAGYTSHPPLSLRTKYYAADVNLWCDELPALRTVTQKPSSDDLSQWKDQMLSDEAAEVRNVIGGIAILLPFNAATSIPNKQDANAEVEVNFQYIHAVNELRDCIEDETGRDIATIAVVIDITPVATRERSSVQEHKQAVGTFAQNLEDTCISEHGIFGWDIVAWQAHMSIPEADGKKSLNTNASEDVEETTANETTDRNEFGEKIGIARVIEVLEQTTWLDGTTEEMDVPIGYDLVSTDDFDLPDDDDFNAPTTKPKISTTSKDPILTQSDEFQSEIMDLHFALQNQNQQPAMDSDDGEDIQVEQLTSLMERVVAIREAASEMSGPDRQAFARREIGKIMKKMNVE